MTAKETLAAWLRDAHAMEGQAVTLLETQIDRLESYPEALPRLKQHVDQTKKQKSDIEQCLADLGEETSTLKDATMKIGANLQGIMHAMSSDEVLKHAIGSNAFENFEAGCYRSLVAAAEHAGEPKIAATCKRIMDEEIEMAEWTWEQLPKLTLKYMARDEQGLAAKR